MIHQCETRAAALVIVSVAGPRAVVSAAYGALAGNPSANAARQHPMAFAIEPRYAANLLRLVSLPTRPEGRLERTAPRQSADGKHRLSLALEERELPPSE